MDPSLALLLTAAMASGAAILSPIILSQLTNRARRIEREIDFARQDEVALKARETAALLLAAQKVTIEKTDQVAETATLRSLEVNTQLRQIHTLVNSDMTAARQGQLDQSRKSLMLLKKVAGMAEKLGLPPPSKEELLEMEETEKHIVELEAILADRMAQMKAVEAEKTQAAVEKKLLMEGHP